METAMYRQSLIATEWSCPDHHIAGDPARVAGGERQHQDPKEIEGATKIESRHQRIHERGVVNLTAVVAAASIESRHLSCALCRRMRAYCDMDPGDPRRMEQPRLDHKTGAVVARWLKPLAKIEAAAPDCHPDP
jgi:hypothetical protein